MTRGLVIGYLVLLVAASAFTGLWLDELHELIGTYNRSFGEMLYWAQYSPGATPLNFIAQKLSLDAFGFSSLSARLPAILFATASLWMFIRIAREYAKSYWLIGAIVFALLPQIFRYGVEARPYSQGLFFALLSFWFWIRIERDGVGAVGFALSVAACLYSQVYSVFPAVGMAAYSLRNPKTRVHVSSAMFMAALSYAPWFFIQRATQTAARAETYALDWANLSVLGYIRELCGGGYFTSIPLLILAIAGAARLRQWPIVFPAVAAMLLPLVADATLGYYFAGRQLIFALPFLILLGISGVGSVPRWAAIVLVAPLLIASVKYDMRQATVTREDWQTPARRLAAQACIYMWGPDQLQYMRVYEPGLRQCDPENLPDEFVSFTTRYSPAAVPITGYSAVKRETVGVAEIVTYRRDASLKTYGLSRFVLCA
jgi:4-amino-4-deoxy-L-arabinose transferase-like glycosyltransferase